jgi:hypothetical protein
MAYIGRGIDQIDNVSTLDNLSFNGSDATFNLTQNSTAFTPVSADALQIQIDGIIQSGNYTVSGSTVTFDFTPSGSSVCNGIKHFGVGVLTTPSDGSVNMAQLGASGTKSSSTFLAGDNSFKTISGTTINNNADNRVITGSGTANTLEGEQNLTFDGGTLTVKDDGSGGTTETLVLTNGTSANPSYSNLVFKTDGNTSGAWIKGVQASGGNDGRLEFHTNLAGTVSERMRIQANGDIHFPNTAGSGYFTFKTASSEPYVVHNGTATGTTTLYMFKVGGSEVGTINRTSSATQYNTSSDYRLKENETAITDGIDRVKQLKPYKFNFKVDPDKTVDGFFAHEVSSIVPEAISGEKDAVYENKDIKPQGIDQSKLVPLLTGALQEAITKIETLETKVEALENK